MLHALPPNLAASHSSYTDELTSCGRRVPWLCHSIARHLRKYRRSTCDIVEASASRAVKDWVWGDLHERLANTVDAVANVIIIQLVSEVLVVVSTQLHANHVLVALHYELVHRRREWFYCVPSSAADGKHRSEQGNIPQDHRKWAQFDWGVVLLAVSECAGLYLESIQFTIAFYGRCWRLTVVQLLPWFVYFRTIALPPRVPWPWVTNWEHFDFRLHGLICRSCIAEVSHDIQIGTP